VQLNTAHAKRMTSFCQNVKHYCQLNTVQQIRLNKQSEVSNLRMTHNILQYKHVITIQNSGLRAHCATSRT